MTAMHRTTFEVTRDAAITETADCIIAVCADRAAATLSLEFREAASRDDALIMAEITCGGCSDTVQGWGSSRMTFSDAHSMVFRVSDFVCGRTVMINADKPASRLSRALIEQLASGNEVIMTMRVGTGRRPEPSLDLLFEG